MSVCITLLITKDQGKVDVYVPFVFTLLTYNFMAIQKVVPFAYLATLSHP